MTGHAFAMAMAALDVNGPEDGRLDWDAIRWRSVEKDVQRLRRRIFAATRAGDYKKVRSLQKLMLRSQSNIVVSVRQVTERNAGRVTAGVDGKVALTSRSKERLVEHIQYSPDRIRPVKRVFIPKANGKLRPLGIPVIADRAQQARVRNALEPEWEARFEPRSYGFRPGRGCHDAIEAIYQVVKGKDPKRQWILDADLKAAFDHIDHRFVLDQIGSFPARGMVRGWLSAGVVDEGHFAPTEEGAPQGGVISPLLLNIVLHGMETAAGVRYRTRQGGRTETAYDCPVLVRYADDLTAFCHSRQQAEQVKGQLAEWLEPRGLAFNEDKTRIVHVNQGCDFLGFNVRRYHNKLPLIKPSPDAVRRIRTRLRAEMRALRGGNAASVLKKLTPIVRGWSAYYRTQVSSEIFSDLDDYMWKLLYKWAKHSHPKKSRWWIIDHYFGRFNKSRNNRWVFGDLTTGAYLPKFAWTKIIRHTMVIGTASPDDPNLVRYWTDRRRKQPPPPLNALVLGLLKTQKCRCVLCGDLLLHADQQPQSPHDWEQWLRTTRMAIRKQHLATEIGRRNDQRLIHASCQRRIIGQGTSTQLTATPLGSA